LKRAPNPFVAELEQRIQLSAAKLWGVQLAAGFDRNRAMASYGRAMRHLRPVIGDQDPSLLSTVYRNRGTRTFYQGADRRRHAARRRRAVQPHPPGRRGLLRAEKQGRAGMKMIPSFRGDAKASNYGAQLRT